MVAIESQITSPTTAYSTVYWDVDQRKHQSSASLASVRGIHRGPVNSPHKWPVTRKMFPFDDVIMYLFTWLSHYSPFNSCMENISNFHMLFCFQQHANKLEFLIEIGVHDFLFLPPCHGLNVKCMLSSKQSMITVCMFLIHIGIYPLCLKIIDRYIFQ